MTKNSDAIQEEMKQAVSEEATEDEVLDSRERVLQRYFLQEWTLVKSIIDGIVASPRTADVSSAHKIQSIVDKYQEQGQLLEPYLESIVSPLMAIICSTTVELGPASDEIIELMKPLSIIIYSLVTVCGYKAVIKFFPHKVSDLELAVALLEKFDVTSSGTSLRQESTGEMEAKCVILLWLCILVLIPFDLASVDTSMANDDNDDNKVPPLVERILGLSRDYLSSSGPMRTISGLLLSRLLTRPDMSKAFIRFIDWSHKVLSSVTNDVVDHFRLLGAVEALAAIFKTGSPKLLLEVVPRVWTDAESLMDSNTAARSPLLRKFLVKFSQRVALTCLPNRSPTWHYMVKNRTLGAHMSSDATARDHCYDSSDSRSDVSCQGRNCLQEEDMDVPEIVEEILEVLLSGLRDTDTVVRWSAAKGIGRITSRLTYSLSDEILSSILELFSPGEGDASWHGGCLALAELGRRGLLLPVNFPKVVPVVVKALHYDIRRGPHSVGAHVRDAAAYVCWAFGRAYYSKDMKPVLDELAPHLLTVACYDREVNCRRAAAAAFQENVGRQGNFPNGIIIVNTADYFALSSRVNSYLHVAACIAAYAGYLNHFVDELLISKICHWEKGLRELASNALSALVKYKPELFASSVLDKLIPCTLSSDLCMRHGATLAVGEVVLALHQHACVLSKDKEKQVAGIVPAIEKARLYRGKGGEIMRSAVSRFIGCISLAHVHLTEKLKRTLLDTLNENLRHPNSHIQVAAVEALKQFVSTYLMRMEEDKDITAFVAKYLEQLRDANVAARRGSALALGVLPFDFLVKQWKFVLSKLCSACAVEENPEDRDAEARANAAKSLVLVCETLTKTTESSNLFSREDSNSVSLFIKSTVMQSLFTALEDYCVDNRGDVGSWVREAAIIGLEKCTYILCGNSFLRSTRKNIEAKSIPELSEESIDEDSHIQLYLDETIATSLVGGLVKQAVEKMDKIRESAAKVLQRIIYNKTFYVPLPLRERLEEMIPEDPELEWGEPSVSYPHFVQLLQLGCYSKYVISGLVISIGGLQDSLRKASLGALLDYLQNTKTKEREVSLSSDLLWVLQTYRRCDRVIVPSLKTIEILFSKMVFLKMEAHTPVFCAELLDCLSTELKGSKDFSKLYSGIAILGYIASISEPVNIQALTHLLSFLGHRYPKIRKAAAEQVYLVLLQNESLVAEDKVDRAVEMISETCWEGDLGEAKCKKFELCDLLGLEANLNASSTSTKAVQQKPGRIDENASYSSLVESAGF